MADLLVDTDVLIDAARGDAAAVTRLDRAVEQGAPGVSTVTYLELLVGCRNKREQHQTERFLRRFEIVRLDPDVSDRAIDLLRQ